MQLMDKLTTTLMTGLMLLTLTNAASAFSLGDDKFKDEVTKEQEAVKLLREVQQGGYGILTTSELKAMIDSNKEVLVIDTMPLKDSYEKNHIPGAKQFLFPIPEMKEWDSKETDGKSKEDYEKLLGPDKNKPIVVYCGFVKCTRSHNGAVWAKKLGYKNVKRYTGGIYAWKGADLPVSSVK